MEWEKNEVKNNFQAYVRQQYSGEDSIEIVRNVENWIQQLRIENGK